MVIFTIGDIIGLLVFAVILLVIIVTGVRATLKEIKCKHQRYYETSACDAICADCGKNLGFIGDVRDRKA